MRLALIGTAASGGGASGNRRRETEGDAGEERMKESWIGVSRYCI
jgi:hypothetical protein